MPWGKNVAWLCCAYQEKMKEICLKNITEIPTPTLEYFRRKRQNNLAGIGVEWCLKNMRNPKPPTKNPRLISK